MTQPSAMLDAIVTRLSARLQPSVASPSSPRITVAQVDDTASADLSEYMTIGTPGVFVTCMGAPQLAFDQVPVTVEAQWMARCYARLGLAPAPDGSKPAGSRGDVAMDLAALVAVIVDEELWLSAGVDPQPTAFRRATRVTLSNRGSRELHGRGLSLWLVTWTQPLELNEFDHAAILHSFTTLHTTFDTRAEQTLELEGATP